MKNIVILISGGGSNMAAIVRAAESERWAERFGARIAAVVSNKADAGGLAIAGSHGIDTAVVPHKDFASRDAFDEALALVNIHPSLLPAFPGLHTHQRAIEAGCKVAGVTVHQVTTELDHGPILAQAAVPVLPDDTAATLAARVLAQEHLLYPRAIAGWLADTLSHKR
jgi:phosphoribosylglycinamide formyltransferase-1